VFCLLKRSQAFLKKISCDTIGGYLPEDIMKKNIKKINSDFYAM
jgi:hypothetical protein